MNALTQAQAQGPVLKVIHCNDSAQWLVQDFLKNASGYSANQAFYNRNGLAYLVIYKNEQQKQTPVYTKTALRKMRKDDLMEIAFDYCINNYSRCTKAELVEWLHTQLTWEAYHEAKFESERWCDLDCDYILRGFSQGDSTKVYLMPGAFEWDKGDLENLLYDSPIRVEVDGEPLDSYYDLVGDDYNLEVATLKKAIIREFGNNEALLTQADNYWYSMPEYK